MTLKSFMYDVSPVADGNLVARITLIAAGKKGLNVNSKCADAFNALTEPPYQ